MRINFQQFQYYRIYQCNEVKKKKYYLDTDSNHFENAGSGSNEINLFTKP
jgi:hypothetical protein